jgi:hypothetical protein
VRATSDCGLVACGEDYGADCGGMRGGYEVRGFHAEYVEHVHPLIRANRATLVTFETFVPEPHASFCLLLLNRFLPCAIVTSTLLLYMRGQKRLSVILAAGCRPRPQTHAILATLTAPAMLDTLDSLYILETEAECAGV